MDSSLLSLLLDESKVRGFLREGAIHMQVKSGTKIKNLVDYISKRLEANDCNQIFCWGLPGAVDKVVTFAEKVKSIWLAKIPTNSASSPFFQCTRIFTHLTQMRIEDYLVKAVSFDQVVFLPNKVYIICCLLIVSVSDAPLQNPSCNCLVNL